MAVSRYRHPLRRRRSQCRLARLEENGHKLEQTRGRDQDPRHEGGDAREQQQIMQDEGSLLYATPSNRSEQSCR